MKSTSRKLASLVVILACLLGCSHRDPVADYTAGWLAVMRAYGEGGKKLSSQLDRNAASKPSPAQRKAVARDMRAIADFMEKTGSQMDALAPPPEFAKLQTICSSFFHDQVPLWRAFADASETGDVKQGEKAGTMIKEFTLSQMNAITGEIDHIGPEGRKLRSGLADLGG